MAASVSGAALLFGGVGIMAEVVLAELASGRRERRRMQERIAGLTGHYIVCGYGRVGATVARELKASGRDVVVVDILPESVERARADGYVVVEGDATTEATLLAAGIERAAGLVASIDEDVNNVYVVLSARTLNAALFIVGRAKRPAAEARLKRAGADRRRVALHDGRAAHRGARHAPGRQRLHRRRPVAGAALLLHRGVPRRGRRVRSTA